MKNEVELGYFEVIFSIEIIRIWFLFSNFIIFVYFD